MIDPEIIQRLSEIPVTNLYAVEIFIVVILFALSMAFVIRNNSSISKQQQAAISRLIEAQVNSQKSQTEIASRQTEAAFDTKRVIEQNNEILSALTEVVREKHKTISGLEKNVSGLKENVAELHALVKDQRIDYTKVEGAVASVFVPRFDELKREIQAYRGTTEAFLEGLVKKERELDAQFTRILENLGKLGKVE